jgi:hypothetical protein
MTKGRQLEITKGRQPISNSTSPLSTACPGSTKKRLTTPARSAAISFSIFMASSTSTPWPTSTVAPSSTSRPTTWPGM